MADGVKNLTFVGVATAELAGCKPLLIVMKDDAGKYFNFTVQAITTRILNRKRQKLATSEEERALAEFLKADDQDSSR